MAVIEDGYLVVSEIFDRMAEQGGASKILMSQRQYDAMIGFFEQRYERDKTADPYKIFDVPVVICPDCDLYIVPPLERKVELRYMTFKGWKGF